MERLDRTLPIELVREILLYTDQSTLAQVALASKTLFELAQPLLYGEVEMRTDDFIPPNFYQLIRTIVENPSLGLLVRSLDLAVHVPIDGYPDQHDWERLLGPSEILDLARIHQHISFLDAFQPLSLWRGGLERPLVSMLSTLLLFHVLNLRELRIDETYLGQTHFIRALQNHNALPLAKLSTMLTYNDGSTRR
ncbi:hypothetical protein BJY00DRAFT_313767 [Aspergillus carlsbadensis]|nr:hypothetical protein BJY00DRAFT_313767 [Aspergillus carlsbadensis]